MAPRLPPDPALPVGAERQPVSAAAGRPPAPNIASARPATRSPGAGEGHRHQGGRAAQPRNGFPDVRSGAAGRHRRRRRQVGPDRADVAGGGQFRRRRRHGGRTGQHPVLRRGQRGEQEQSRAVPGDHHRAVRGDRAADRSRTGPTAARPTGGAGASFVLRTVLAVVLVDELRRRHQQLPVLGPLPVRTGHDGALEIVQRAAQRGDAPGDATERSTWCGSIPG